MGIRIKLHHKLRNITWMLCGLMVLAFIAGVIPDIDHPLSQILGITDGRFLHPAFGIMGYILVGCGVIILITLLGRHFKPGILK